MRYHFYLISLILFTACKGEPENIPVAEEENKVIRWDDDKSLPSQELRVGEIDSNQSAEFNWDEEGFNKKFDLRAYIDDPDDAPTNMRDTPNGKVIQKLPQGEDYMFNIIAQRDGWFQITDLISFSEEIEIQKTSGWIHASVVGASTRFCCDEGVPLYKYPDASDEFYIDQIPFERSIKIKELYADYAFVTFKSESEKSLEGWINQEWICGNPVTTCP